MITTRGVRVIQNFLEELFGHEARSTIACGPSIWIAVRNKSMDSRTAANGIATARWICCIGPVSDVVGSAHRDRHGGAGADYSGNPALRMASAYLAASCGRRSGVKSPRFETRNAGSIWRS